MSEEETKPGKALEQQVAGAYRRMDARKVEHGVEMDGHQIDVYAELETADRSVHRIAVEAKDHARPVGIKIVGDFSDIVDRLRRRGIVDEGVIVSTSGFSPRGRDAAKGHVMRLLTIEDLEAIASRVEKGERWRPAPYTPLVPPGQDELPEPGGLPPGSYVSFKRNALFTGRERALKRLARALLHKDHPSALVTQAVAGMGGVGKTQLAVEFVYRYGRFFHGVHWVNCQQETAIGAEVAACGERMCLPYWPEKQPGQVARTLDAWCRGGPRLVVLDNLEDVESAREWLGRLSGGAVRAVVTARRRNWPRDLGLAPLPLKVFDEKESRAFLREYLSEERATDAELDGLAERLGHLPLALELAGRYLKSAARLTVGEYLEKIENVWAHASMADWRAELGNPTGHDLDLAETFAASWERVEDETARQVFLMLGWCAPNEAVPCEVLEKAAELDTERCDAAVGVLAELGLVEVEDPQAGALVHPLLAEFGRSLAGAGEALEAVAEALGTLTQEAGESGLPARFVPLRAHVEAVVPVAEEAELEDAGMLWNNLGYHLEDVADYAGARECYGRALAIDERVFGPDHPEVATDVNNLGSVLHDLGDLEGARAAYGRALAIDERVFGPDHPTVALRVNNLGSVLQDLGDLEGARESFGRALGILERFLPEGHPGIEVVRGNLEGLEEAGSKE